MFDKDEGISYNIFMGTIVRHTLYRYRIYPNEPQRLLIRKTFGCVRFVYNKCFDFQESSYRDTGHNQSRFSCNDYCNNTLKSQYPWLREVDKFSLTNAIFNLDKAYKAFFDGRSDKPKYKKKNNSRQSYTTNFCNKNIEVTCKSVKLPKLGHIKAVIHRTAPVEWKLKSATIKIIGTEYYCIILYEYETKDETINIDTNRSIGLDFKIDGFFHDSENKICGSLHVYKKTEQKINKLNASLSRKKKGSKNFYKNKARLIKLHNHITNKRHDFLHKKSTEIANQYDVVCVENLTLKGLANSKFRNGKSIHDNGYGMFVDMLDYKLNLQGKKLVKIDRFYPSSQICSNCESKGHIALDKKIYHCEFCGVRINRDFNAAQNILKEGLRIYNSEQNSA